MAEEHDERFQVLDEDDDTRLKLLDISGAECWGPKQEYELDFSGEQEWSVSEWLYRLTSGQFVLVTDRVHRASLPHVPYAKKQSDEEAARWLTLNGYDPPYDIASLGADCHFEPESPVQLSEVPKNRAKDQPEPESSVGQSIDEDPTIAQSRSSQGANSRSTSGLKRPSDKAFKVWRLRDLTGIANQTRIAEELTKQGFPTTQGEVSRALKQVKEYLRAGNILPQLKPLTGDIQPIDPGIIELGQRGDGLTERQRPRRSPDSDD